MKTAQLLLGNDSSDFKNYWKESGRKFHGGEHACGKRKTKRPFSPSKPIHIVMRSEKARLNKFLRSISRYIARFVTGACKGNAKGKFWDHLTFSRVIEWGRAFKIAKDYVLQNFLEAEGLIEYRPRKSRTTNARNAT